MTPRIPWPLIADVLESTIGFESESIRASWSGESAVYRHTPPDRLPHALAEQLVRALLAGAGIALPITTPEARPNGPLDVGGERSGWSQSWPEKAETRTAQEAAQQPQEGASPAVDLPRFVRLTKRVREAQRAYFKTRDATVLAQSKALEGKLDQWIELLAPENKKQTGLFKDKS